MSETLVGINGFGRIGRIVFRNAYVPHYAFSISHRVAGYKLTSYLQRRARCCKGRGSQ